MITIDDITFDHALARGDGEVQEISVTGADIRYTVYQGSNKIDGEVSFSFRDYKDKTYSELITLIKQHFNNAVDKVG